MQCDYSVHSVMPHFNGLDVVIRYRCGRCDKVLEVTKRPPKRKCFYKKVEA